MSGAVAIFGALSLPLGDPQFWLVTAVVALVGFFAVRRIRRSIKAEGETPCASCPKVAPPARSAGPSLVMLGGGRRERPRESREVR